SSPPSTSSAGLILYRPPTLWSLLRGAAINLVLPFINGLMLGLGELLAHEAAFQLGWFNTKVHASPISSFQPELFMGSSEMPANVLEFKADIVHRFFQPIDALYQSHPASMLGTFLL